MSSQDKKHFANSSVHLEDFDFTEWKNLYQEDPEAFENKRQLWIDSLISSAPQEYHQRLNGLMFQINAKRDRSSNPIQACMDISKMMWTSTADLRTFLEELACLLQNQKALDEREKRTADILDFCR